MRIGAAALLLAALASPADAAGLTSPEALAKVYELILDARFDDGERQLKTACPPAPQPGCAVVGAVADYWRLLINPEDTSRDTGSGRKSEKQGGRHATDPCKRGHSAKRAGIPENARSRWQKPRRASALGAAVSEMQTRRHESTKTNLLDASARLAALAFDKY